MEMRDLIDKVAIDLKEKLEEFNVRDLEVNVLEDYFVVKEKDTFFSDYFYCKVDRSNYEVVEIKMKRKESLQKINECAKIIVDELSAHAEDFNKLFGLSIKTLDDLKNNMVFLLDSAIDKNYRIGMEVPSNNWSDTKYFYGVSINPSGWFDISFTTEDKQSRNKENMRFYCEFEKDTIDVNVMADFLCKIIDKNIDCLEKYYKKGLENG